MVQILQTPNRTRLTSLSTVKRSPKFTIGTLCCTDATKSRAVTPGPGYYTISTGFKLKSGDVPRQYFGSRTRSEVSRVFACI